MRVNLGYVADEHRPSAKIVSPSWFSLALPYLTPCFRVSINSLDTLYFNVAIYSEVPFIHRFLPASLFLIRCMPRCLNHWSFFPSLPLCLFATPPLISLSLFPFLLSFFHFASSLLSVFSFLISFPLTLLFFSFSFFLSFYPFSLSLSPVLSCLPPFSLSPFSSFSLFSLFPFLSSLSFCLLLSIVHAFYSLTCGMKCS